MKIKDKKVIIYIVAAIILMILVGFLVITNKEKRGEWVTLEEDNSQDEILESNDYYSIINYLKLNTLPDEYYGYFYTEDNLKQRDIKNNIKIYMAIRKVIADKGLSNIDEEIKINESDVTKSLKEIFGNIVEYSHESLSGNTCSYTNFTYDKDSKTYIQKPSECIEPRTDTILYEIVDTKEEDGVVIIQEKVGFIENSYNLETKKLVYNIYKDVDKLEKIATVDNYSIDSCKELLYTYKYTFKKDNNNYYLESIDVIK